jgi:hypothetical protein
MSTDNVTQTSHIQDTDQDAEEPEDLLTKELQHPSANDDPTPPPRNGRRASKNNPSSQSSGPQNSHGPSEKSPATSFDPAKLKSKRPSELAPLPRALHDLQVFVRAFSDCAKRIEREVRPYIKQAEQLEKLSRLGLEKKPK